MKKSIKILTNKLIGLLDICGDEELVDDVCMRVSSNDPFPEQDDTHTPINSYVAELEDRWEDEMSAMGRYRW